MTSRTRNGVASAMAEEATRWDAARERIEMHLVSIGDQVLSVPACDLTLAFADGESIQTEISAKFRLDGLAPLLEKAGFGSVQTWTDDAGDFALSLALVA